MVYYIRLLQTPKVGRSSCDWAIRMVATITTDLGESFYPEDVELSVYLTDKNGKRAWISNRTWFGGMRALPLKLIVKNKQLVGPIQLNICRTGSRIMDELFLSDLQGIVGAWSATVELSNGSEGAKKIERRFDLGHCHLHIWEEIGESIARHIWDAGIALVAHTQDMIDDWDRKPSWLVNRNMLFNKEKRIHMLELGCGCGIVGISLAQSLPYCSVMLTDLPEAMEILDANIAIAQPAKASKIMQATLDWEQELPPLITCTKYDLIIVSDCTYNADSLPALIKTLLALQTISKDVSIVVSTKVRHSSEAVFFTLMLDAGFCTTETFSISLPDTNRSQLAESLEKVDIYIFHHKASRHHLETIS